MKPSGPGHFLVGRLLITSSISSCTIGLFRLSISSWLSFGDSQDFRYSSISSRFSNLVEYRFLKYSHMIVWIFSLSVVIFPLSSQILLIWSCSFFLLVNWARGLSILFILSKNQLLDSLIFFVLFSLFLFH